MEQQFGIVITAQARHGDLWRASKKLGSQSAVARYLGVCPSVFGRWVNLQDWPGAEAWRRVEDKMLVLTGKSYDELWPVGLRAAITGGEVGKRLEAAQTVTLRQLAAETADRNLLPSPADVVMEREKLDDLAKILHTLPKRQQRVLELRYGLGGETPLTYEAAGAVLGISKERARQLEMQALRKLRNRAQWFEGLAP